MVTRLFEIEAIASGSVWERDVNCPSQWIGSGVYDVDYPAWQKVRLEVAASCMEDALELANKYSSKDWNFSVEDMWYLSAKDTGRFECDELGIFDFEEEELNWGKWQG